MAKWIVVVEAAGDAGCDSIGVDQLQTLAGLLGAAALHHPDRYALQLSSSGTRAIDALDRGLTQWEDAVAALGLPRWPLARAEVFTPEELEWELSNGGVAAEGTGVALENRSEDTGVVSATADELLRDVFRDPLTGLGNETVLQARLGQALARAGHTQFGPAVVRLDLDGFDSVNRRFGYSAGDHILLTVGQRLSAAVRRGDSVARLGSDDFAILLEDASHDAVASVTERIVSALRSPVVVADQEVAPVASAGIAWGKPGQLPDDVLGAAGAALSAAKAAGGDRVETFQGEIDAPDTEPVDHQGGHQDRLSYLLVMQRAAAAANQATTLQEAAEVVLRQVCAHTGWPVGHLLVVCPERPQELISTGIWHLPANDRYRTFREATEAASFAAGIGLPGRVLTTGQPVWVSDLSTNPEPERATAAAQDGLSAALAFPVLVGDEVVAVLEFFSPETRQLNGPLLDVLAGVGTQLGRVVERSRAHDALRASEKLLREAQALGRLGSWHTDLRTGRTAWSEELYDILGLDKATTPPTLDAFLDVVHPEDREMVEADARHRAVVGDAGSPLEVRVVRPDGDLRWVVRRSSFVSDDAGDLVAFHATVQDITEHKRTAECSLSCEVRWHLMLQGSQEFLTLLNEDGTIRLSLAPVGMDPLGSPGTDPTPYVDVVHPDDVGIVRQALSELLADPDCSVAFQGRFRDDIGEWRWFDSIATNLLDEPLIGAIVINSLDVTAWKSLQDRLTEVGGGTSPG